MKMLKICSVLPDIHMPMADMGRDFAGAMATSHAFFIFSVSISSSVGGLRLLVVTSWAWFLEDPPPRLETVEVLVDGKPGGSGMLDAFLDLVIGGALMSRTHCGGGGGGGRSVGEDIFAGVVPLVTRFPV